MKNYKLHISEGYRDIFGSEMQLKMEMERRILHLFQGFGYEPIQTPTVEYIDVYSTHGIQKPDVYNLINRQGEVLALRNDTTASIARFVCSNALEIPLKYCYRAEVFRYPRQYQGKNHEFLQCGIEIIGDESFQNDIECIYLGHKALINCGVQNFTIHIGSIRFLNTLLDDLEVSNAVKEKIFMAIETKDYVELEKLLRVNLEPSKADLIMQLMLQGGRIKYIEKLMEEVKAYKANFELVYLKRVYDTLSSLGVKSMIFDFSISSYASYYTGIVFSFYIEGISKAILEGGRCANLFHDFGKPYDDIGFGIDVDVLTSYVLSHHLIDFEQEKYLSFSMDKDFIYASCCNETFREQNRIVNHLDFSSLEEALSYAKKEGYTKVIVYEDSSYRIVEVETC